MKQATKTDLVAGTLMTSFFSCFFSAALATEEWGVAIFMGLLLFSSWWVHISKIKIYFKSKEC